MTSNGPLHSPIHADVPAVVDGVVVEVVVDGVVVEVVVDGVAVEVEVVVVVDVVVLGVSALPQRVISWK